MNKGNENAFYFSKIILLIYYFIYFLFIRLSIYTYVIFGPRYPACMYVVAANPLSR